MGGQYNSQNTIEFLDFVFSGGLAVKASLADGKIGFEDAGNLMLVFPKVGPAFQDIGQIPSELGELDAEDSKAVVDYFRPRFPQLAGDDEKLLVILNKGIVAGLSLAELVAVL